MARFLADSVDATIGKRIQQRRKEAAWTAEQLAEQIGVSQQQFSRYERGTTKINVSHLVKIAVVLDTPISWFFADSCADNLNFSAQVHPVPVVDDELKQRLDYQWQQLNKEQKRQLVIFLDSMMK